MLSEQQIENRLRQGVKVAGGKALKFVSPGCRGVPDRLVFMPGGQIYLVELKAPGKTPNAQQKKRKKEFEKMGFRYFVIDTYEAVEGFLNEVLST